MQIQEMRCEVHRPIVHERVFAPGSVETDGEASNPGPRLRRRGARSEAGREKILSYNITRSLLTSAKVALAEGNLKSHGGDKGGYNTAVGLHAADSISNENAECIDSNKGSGAGYQESLIKRRRTIKESENEC